MERKSVALRAAFRHLRLPDHRRHGRRLLPGARRRPHHLADGARALQGLHLDPEAERLPLDPHHRDRPRRASASSCRSAPARWTRSPNTASRRTRSTRTAAPTTSRLAGESRAYQWLRRTDRPPRRGRQPGGVPRAHEARAVPRPGLLLHAEGPADRAAARGDADRLRLCGPHRRRQHRRRLQDQRPHGAAPDRAANGDEVEIVRAEGQTPPAAWESLVVTGKARAAIRRATRAAVRAAICRARTPDPRARLRARRQGASRTTSSRARCRGWRGHRSTMCSPRSGAARCFPATWSAPCSPTSRRSAAPPRPRRTRAAGSPRQGLEHQDQAAAEGLGRRERHPDPRARLGSAGALRPRGGAVPGDRIVGILTPGRRRDDLSDPVAGARRLRQRARALARRALGHRSARRRSASRPGSSCNPSTSRGRSRRSPR